MNSSRDKLRPVNVSYPLKEPGDRKCLFHCFSQDYEEFESGPGNYPVAIVEDLKTGEVFACHTHYVRFTDV